MLAGWLEFFQEVNGLPNLYIPALVNNVINHSVSSCPGESGGEGTLPVAGTIDGRQGKGTEQRTQLAKPSVLKASWARAREALRSCEVEAREKARAFRSKEGGIPEDWDDDDAWEAYVKA
eukprot:6455172-Heterocapsa_arctica.AAC.1